MIRTLSGRPVGTIGKKEVCQVWDNSWEQAVTWCRCENVALIGPNNTHRQTHWQTLFFPHATSKPSPNKVQASTRVTDHGAVQPAHHQCSYSCIRPLSIPLFASLFEILHERCNDEKTQVWCHWDKQPHDTSYR